MEDKANFAQRYNTSATLPIAEIYAQQIGPASIVAQVPETEPHYSKQTRRLIASIEQLAGQGYESFIIRRGVMDWTLEPVGVARIVKR